MDILPKICMADISITLDIPRVHNLLKAKQKQIKNPTCTCMTVVMKHIHALKSSRKLDFQKIDIYKLTFALHYINLHRIQGI
jgi:hypothetical protein